MLSAGTQDLAAQGGNAPVHASSPATPAPPQQLCWKWQRRLTAIGMPYGQKEQVPNGTDLLIRKEDAGVLGIGLKYPAKFSQIDQ